MGPSERTFRRLYGGKDRIIQEASSGGPTSMSARGQGFRILQTQRRFVSAAGAEKTDCIPSLTRDAVRGDSTGCVGACG